jgi:transcriptional regulator with XRE-family HTH domain
MKSVEGKRWSALRYQRNLRGWSQKELARRLSSITDQEDTLREKIAGVTGDMIRKWENGYHLPSPFYRRRLCRLFNLSAVELGFVADLAEEEKKDFPEQSSGKSGSSS